MKFHTTNMRSLLILLYLLCSFYSTLLARYHSNFFVPYYDNGKWGYMDFNGQMVIQPFTSFRPGFFNRYNYAEFYNSQNKKGLINDSAHVILPCQYDSILTIQENAFVVSSGNKVYKVVKKSGLPLIKGSFKQLELSKRSYKWIPSKKLKNGTYTDETVIYYTALIAVGASGIELYHLHDDGKYVRLKYLPGVFKFNAQRNYEDELYGFYYFDPKIKRQIYLDLYGDEPKVDALMEDIGLVDIPTEYNLNRKLNNWELTLDTLPHDFISDDGERSFSSKYNVVRFKGKWGVVSENRCIVLPFDCDTVIKDWENIVYKRQGYYDWYDLRSHTYHALHADTIIDVFYEGVLAKLKGRYSFYDKEGNDKTPHFQIDTFIGHEWIDDANQLLVYSISHLHYAVFTSNGLSTTHKYKGIKRIQSGYMFLYDGDSTSVMVTHKKKLNLLGPYKGRILDEKRSLMEMHLFQIQLANGVWVYVDASGRKYFKE